MVTIVQTVPATVVPVYTDIIFDLIEYTNLDDPATAVDVTIFVDGQDKKKLSYKADSLFDAGGGLQGNTFQINISEFLQSCFDNEASLCPLGMGGVMASAECSIEFYIEICSWIPSETGCLEKEEVTVTSQTFIGVNARPKPCGDQFLTEWLTAPLSVGMTNKPLRTLVCLGDSECLSFFNADGGGFAIITGYTNGAIAWSEGLALPADPNSVNTVGVGPSNIDNTTFINNPVTIDNTIDYYEVAIFDPSGAQIIPKRRYYIDKCCCVCYRLHFLNCFGKFDSVSIYRTKYDTYEVTAKTFEKTRPLFFSSTGFEQGRGVNRLWSKATEGFQGTFYRLKKDEADWLKELKNSPNIFIEKDGIYKPVYIKGGKFVQEDNNSTAVREARLSFTYSNSEYSHRN